MELSTFCDIKACTIVINPQGEIQTWPENLEAVKVVLNMYSNYKPQQKGMGKDAVMRPSSGKEGTSASVPKPAKDNKRKRDSASEDLDLKTRMTRKPRKNTIPLTKEYVRRLRDEDEEEENNHGSILALALHQKERNALKLISGQKEQEIIDPRAELTKAHQDQTDLIEKVMKILKAPGLDSGTMANISISQLQQKIERIEQFREEVDQIKAESLGWKEGMDRFAAEKETARA
uniref:Agamous-like MADS-box protein AGL81 n=1 Tax=Nicotiana tabacum TaxID=4097 RepID=A0A1S3Z5N6_TOBAC|nr:PREDICTED: agamous-like MADS-box protein AGL81 [Nicotiana tabacum]